MRPEIEAPYWEKVERRFWRKVDKSGPNGCWVWTGGLSRGYGAFMFEGSMIRSHRMSFMLTHGRWPEPLCCHHCDNPPCVNPAHLYEGTDQDNANDMMRRGRHARSRNAMGVKR